MRSSNELVVEAYRLGRYDNETLAISQLSPGVVEAYRLGRYDNCYFPVSTPGAQQFEETMDGNDKAPSRVSDWGAYFFA